MRSVILFCPHLNRDIRGILARVPNPTIETGYKTDPGHDGCLEMHKSVVRKAKDDGEPCVFVVEDDCEFTEHFHFDVWSTSAEWASWNGYDLMVGGSTRTYDEKVVHNGMIEVSAFHSAHCLVYFASGYDKVMHAVQPYDYSLGRDCGLRCVLVHPFVAVQKPSFSGILQEHVDYVPLYKNHEAHLAKALNL